MSVLVVLGVIWAAVLVPSILRARAERRAEFIDSFRQQMGALGQKAARMSRTESDVRRRRMAAVKRRRDILGGLLGAMIGSLVLGAIPSLRIVWVLHLFLLNTAIAYIALLAHQRGLALRRRGRAVAPVWGGERHLARRGRKRPGPALAPALHVTRR